MTLARENDWIGADEQWPLSEATLEKFLDGDNWQTIIGALQKAKE